MSTGRQFPVFTTFIPVSRVSACLLSPKHVFYQRFLRGVNLSQRLRYGCSCNRSLRVSMSFEEKEYRADSGVSLFGDSQFVEVIGVGSRKDAVLDFCSDSHFELSSSLRFWNIHAIDPLNVQLQERVFRQDLNPRILEASQFLQSCSPAIIIVSSAGYGLDHVTAIDILKTIRSRNGFAVAIFLRPFSFEGQRRQDEMKDLVAKLQAHTNFWIDIDTDTLLKKDLVTLDEALKTANTAVLLAINTISVLISSMHQKVIDMQDSKIKELKFSEIMKILESYKEAKIGFGAGDNIKSSILKALYDCPFIGATVENSNGITICVIASSGVIEKCDVETSLLTFRETAEYKGKIIISTAHEPNLDSNTIVTTVVTLGCDEVQTSQKSSLLSRLAYHFPFVNKFLRRHHQQLDDDDVINGHKDAEVPKTTNSPDSDEMEISFLEGLAGGVDKDSEEHERLPSSSYNDIYGLGSYNNGSYENEIDLLDARAESLDFYDETTKEAPALQREQLARWNLGPGYQIAQEWAKERAGDTSMLDDLSIFHLPVGVRPMDGSKEGLDISYAAEIPESNAEGVIKEQKLANSSIASLGALTDNGFLLVREFYNNASMMLKGKQYDAPKKQGVLSVRAASMLEAERDSPKKWSPIMEMQYRGGVYKGRCQGGLPEGKGRLILGDGSLYDGIWRYGKRSGPGAFCFSNGDVFQGSWRDDLMHGKGWFYFHTGDRWFANFWKGKANGESRFYSKSGEVFFGQFQDGWRHGHFLCIDVDGARYIETWDEGVLMSRKQLDSDSDAG
ncbi:protein ACCUMULATION AND REPLICATION OF CHLOROPLASTS 3, chloroplastic isoform X2 [Euphorbia lathyris]|uniref:protein ACCUMULATION AND REPLICATION OF CHLOROPLASTS 3, chloroplastic isoform X2 n=1 Tax=Euphorbia lathyris TaxID=212925 RepID=UPI00331326F9